MSFEKESSQERSAHHAHGQGSSSLPSSTDSATFAYEEYPINEDRRLPVGNKLQPQATPPWYQEHGEFNNTSFSEYPSSESISSLLLVK
jgi:hypothetical protein